MIDQPATLQFGETLSRNTNSPQYIVWHHSQTVGDPSALDIHRWHLRRVDTDGKKWSGIGYHYVIRKSGVIEKGRPTDCAGAHARGLNSKSIGICFSGDLDRTDPTKEQMAAALALSRHLLDQYEIRPDCVIGHREINELVNRGLIAENSRTNKSCPGKTINMNTVRAKLQGRVLFRTGADIMHNSDWEMFKGKRIGLVTNQTGILFDSTPVWQKMIGSDFVDLRAIFCPEHGFDGKKSGPFVDDEISGIPLLSLHKKISKRPGAAQLGGVDVLIYDMQDAGVRFFTHISTLKNILEEAAKAGIRVVVLDRPNPQGGTQVEGPILPSTRQGFNVGPHTIPIQYGLTPGELALMLNKECGISADLVVVPMDGWDPSNAHPFCLPWIGLSPNLSTTNALSLYPGLGLLEPFLKGANFDVGRNSACAFQRIGAPWLNGERLKIELDKLDLPGVTILPVGYYINSTGYQGVSLCIVSHTALRPIHLSLSIAIAIWRQHPSHFTIDKLNLLLADQHALRAIENGASADEVLASWRPDLTIFLNRCVSFFIYDR